MKYIVVWSLAAAIILTVVCYHGTVAADQPGIYYINAQGKLEKEYRPIFADPDLYAALAQAVLEQPQSPHLRTAVPRGVRLYGVWLQQGILFVNYTRELFAYGGGTYREQRLLAQIVYTLTQTPEVQQVQLLIEGQAVLAPEGSPTDTPLARKDL